MPPLDETGAGADRPLETIRGSQAVEAVEPFWVKQRQAGEHPTVKPVGLGVLGVIVAQVGGPLWVDQDNGCPAGRHPPGQRHPRVACRLHDHGDLRAVGDLGPQRLQLGWSSPEPPARPCEFASFPRQAGPVMGTASHVYA